VIPAVVPDRDRWSAANGRLYAVELLANQFVGPPLGGLLVAVAISGAFGTAAAGYLVAAALILTLPGSFRADRAGPPTSMRTDIAEGIRFLARHRLLRTLALVIATLNLGGGAMIGVLVLYAVAPGPMGLSGTGYGILTATIGVGSLLGTWLAVPAERRLSRVRTLVLSVVLTGAGLVVPALTANAVLIGVSFVVSGVAMVLWNVVTVSLRQRITPDRLLGRMNAAYRLVGWGTMPIGAALGGFLAEVLGLRPTFAVSATLTALTLAGFRFVTEEAIDRAEAAEAATG